MRNEKSCFNWSYFTYYGWYHFTKTAWVWIFGWVARCFFCAWISCFSLKKAWKIFGFVLWRRRLKCGTPCAKFSPTRGVLWAIYEEIGWNPDARVRLWNSKMNWKKGLRLVHSFEDTFHLSVTPPCHPLPTLAHSQHSQTSQQLLSLWGGFSAYSFSRARAMRSSTNRRWMNGA